MWCVLLRLANNIMSAGCSCWEAIVITKKNVIEEVVQNAVDDVPWNREIPSFQL